MKSVIRSTCFASLLAFLWLSGCATLPVTERPLLQQCQIRLQALQQRVRQERVGDAQAQAVSGFPHYRTNRFWSGFATKELDEEQQRFWRQQLHKLAFEGLRVEWLNLSWNGKDTLLNQYDLTTFDVFEWQCSEILFVESLKQYLPQSAMKVEESYNDWQRVLGLYAVTKYGAAGSIAEYQNEMRGYFESYNAAALKQPLRYIPETISREPVDWSLKLQVARSENPLFIPLLNPTDLKQLARQYAPDFVVAQRTSADRIGAARWLDDERKVDTTDPVVYFNPGYIRYQDQVLLQLSYTAWFPERPKPSRFDWYGGKLDGLVWRVTLKPDGSVLFYDSIHPCGCYHTVHFPEGSELAQKMLEYEVGPALEPILFFHTSVADSTSRLQLSVVADTHYLVQVNKARKLPGEETKEAYVLKDYDELRTLSARQPRDSRSTKNWFDADGVIASSARFERYFLWPLGVPSAGAMRQQGHHAIAFVGKRHFDESDVELLLDLRR